MTGRVYIVGAGPGDPRLITVRGLECIRYADVLIYDRLLDPALLHEAPARAECIYVGKESTHHTLPQDQINELLAMHASLGKTVVRLKGGDPLVLGRGGEEAAFLKVRGIASEIVPGVSSATGVPAVAGIPVTYRGVSNSFAVVTGHCCKPHSSLDYATLFRNVDTLVVLMGAKALPAIVDQLLKDGIDPATPIAIVEQGTHPEERTTVSTLREVERESRGAKPPAVIVLGEVVALRQQITQEPSLPESLLALASNLTE